MAVEDQRGLALVTEQAGDQHRFRPLHLHSGKSWMGLETVHVRLEPVTLEAGLLERQRHEVLCGALVAGHRWDPDEILRQPDAGVGVQRLERPGFWSLPDHGVSVIGSGGEVEGAVAVGIANTTQEDAIFATFWLDRCSASWAMHKHDEKIGAVDQLELRDFGRKFGGLRGKDAGRHEKALHQFAGGDQPNELADLTHINVGAGKLALHALDDGPLFRSPKEEVGATVRTVLADELRRPTLRGEGGGHQPLELAPG